MLALEVALEVSLLQHQPYKGSPTSIAWRYAAPCNLVRGILVYCVRA